MKVLFDYGLPFFMAHGGLQTQIEQTFLALQEIGVEVEHVRWWDATQTGDILHYFGRPASTYVKFAQQRGLRFVMSELLTGLGSRSTVARAVQKAAITGMDRLVPGTFGNRMGWESFRMADACIALTPWEAELMKTMFQAPPTCVHVVPNGVEKIFFETSPAVRGEWMVCTATITERKRVVELARAAVAAGTPLRLIGKPYSKGDTYHQCFLELMAEHPQYLRYDGAISDRPVLARVYREARGFVLLSAMESLSLSALEAAACECPLLLSDLPWARSVFRDAVSYCDISNSVNRTSRCLRSFYDAAPGLKRPPKPVLWTNVAEQLRTIYVAVLSTSR